MFRCPLKLRPRHCQKQSSARVIHRPGRRRHLNSGAISSPFLFICIMECKLSLAFRVGAFARHPARERGTQSMIVFGRLLLVFGSTALLAVMAVSQPPPDDQGPGRDEGPPGGPGRFGPPPFQPGRVLPPPIRRELGLSSDQQKQLDALEKEVKQRLLKILTATQRRKLRQMAQRGPGQRSRGRGEGPNRDGSPPDGDRGQDRDAPPPRRDRDPSPPDQTSKKNAPQNSSSAGIQWFATWQSGLQEARRTGKPILLVSGAPHCAGVSGIW